MKNVNIVSLVQAHGSLQEESYTKFLSYYGIKIRDKEAMDLALLVSVLNEKTSNKNIFNQFYVDLPPITLPPDSEKSPI